MKKFFLFILINVFLICNANAITLIEAIKEAYDNNPKLNAESASSSPTFAPAFNFGAGIKPNQRSCEP